MRSLPNLAPRPLRSAPLLRPCAALACLALPAAAQLVPGVPGQCPPVHSHEGFHQQNVGRALAAQGERCFFGGGTAFTVGFYEKQSNEQWLRIDLFGGPNLDPQAFGSAVAWEGASAVIGDWGDDTLGNWTGAAAVASWDAVAEDWTVLSELLPPAPESGAKFGGAVAISPDETVVVVGASNTGGLGAAYVYDHDPVLGTTALAATLAPPALQDYDRFGGAVAAGDGLVFVGAPTLPGPGTGFGAVYVFEDTGAGWTQQAVITPDAPQQNESFGLPIVYDDGRLFVGAAGHSLPQGHGAVYAFESVGGSWTQTAFLTAETGTPTTQFGRSLDADGDRLAVGASRRAFVFERIGGTWTKTHRITDPTGITFSEFGSAVALYGDGLLVGAWQWDSNGFEYPADVGGVFDFDLTDAGEKLMACGHRVSVQSGGSERLLLCAPASAGDAYWILGSATGQGPLPIGPVSLPLTFDPYFLTTLSSAGGGTLPGGFGTLDANGSAEADFLLPPGQNPGLVGLALHHAALFGTAAEGVVKATNAVTIELIP